MTFLNNLDLSLWQDCDDIYRKHQQLCLSFQDEHQVNVNLLLLALWLDSQEKMLSATQWQTLQQDTLKWEEKVLLPYRKLRRLSKSCLSDTEYQQMLEVELMLERKSQRLILHALNQLAWQGDSSNLSSYLALFNLCSEHYPCLTSAASTTHV
ncbi:TIGR02444 family protein [Shewanella sp. KX20019]|uniref:TIGR02444 family protein n=1 Tax=Shewanella sp. KX20019 TaxID=2803864 RepID=UPI0019269C1B|nr:TIGR02444 family protein [Shewanella sp. KX20019]QQX79545.1 TIGR02444 family protein [Shewanella sp. KX20019]